MSKRLNAKNGPLSNRVIIVASKGALPARSVEPLQFQAAEDGNDHTLNVMVATPPGGAYPLPLIMDREETNAHVPSFNVVGEALSYLDKVGGVAYLPARVLTWGFPSCRIKEALAA